MFTWECCDENTKKYNRVYTSGEDEFCRRFRLRTSQGAVPSRIRKLSIYIVDESYSDV